jgi:phosphoribosyl 1,2-cyclic phosphodiesterase
MTKTSSYIRFWGVRGSFASPRASHLKVGGNTACVELRVGSYLIICDGGTGIIPLGEALCADPSLREAMVVFTHYHWDHICGMPFFVPAFLPHWDLHFFGPGDNAEEIEKRLSEQMRPPYFPVETETWQANIEYIKPRRGGLTYGPIEISYCHAFHPGVTYGYRFRVNGKSIVYVSDNEVLFLEKSIANRMHEFGPEEHAMLEQVKAEERETELETMRGADILIHDAQYNEEDYAKKRGWGHSCYVDTVNCAIDAGVKELYLFHHDPSYNDEMVEEIHRKSLEIIKARNSALICHVAREGLRIDF